MTAFTDEQHGARATLTYLAEPGDPALAALLRVCEPAEVVAAVRAGKVPAAVTAHGAATEMGDGGRARLEHAIGLWRSRLAAIPAGADLAAFRREGIRLACPGDPEWPTQLDALGSARPYALWLRGNADLRYCCLRSVSIVGARAATAYGAHVSAQMSAALSERGWTVVSGGAYGIDGCAHRGALAADGVTVAVLACGVDYAYPRGHETLLAAIAAQGVVVSEWPPGTAPMRQRFLVRNRVIGALTRGTVVVEAGLRSGALSTAAHTAGLGRPLMAVPGPVTSDLSAGCHKIIREWGASCVTCAQDVIELLAPLGESAPAQYAAARQDRAPGHDDAPGRGSAVCQIGMPGGRDAPVLSHDDLDPVTAAVLDAVPALGGAGPARIAVTAGLGLDAVIRSLGLLAAGGFIERCDRGWKVRRYR
ncbi:MAG TPA: DNA-processing protein DprA [Streptosporangiaceae bacterium]|nr:DNA-processing protein DprA [Streptosporangiaceae bacterium]